MKILAFLLVFALGLSAGFILCAAFPEIPTKVGKILFPGDGNEDEGEDEGETLTLEQINEVISGSRALVESQHTYYVHVTRNGKFAETILELGSRKESGGTVMVLKVWNASDAVATPSPLHRYLFKILPFSMGPDKKKGFAVVAYPADKKNDGPDWPLFLSVIPDAKGGILGMTSRDTWEIKDAAGVAEIRALLQRGEVTLADLEKFSPEKFTASSRIENFKKEVR